MTATVIYQGELRTLMQHVSSGQQVITDAPVDNQGRGAAFSPTDLVATALGACMLTVMGIKAREMNVNLEGASITVLKTMGINPRRITEIHLQISNLPKASARERSILEHTAQTCPVHHSLHPDLQQIITFEWPD